MNMKTTASTPEEYIDLLAGWPRDCVQHLQNHVRSSANLDEEIKWGHLVYSSNGPAIYIRAEEDRVLFGFWRGKRLREIEPNLKAGGKYEMARIEIRSEPYPSAKVIRRLVQEAVRLNEELGNPQDAAKK